MFTLDWDSHDSRDTCVHESAPSRADVLSGNFLCLWVGGVPVGVVRTCLCVCVCAVQVCGCVYLLVFGYDEGL